MSVSGGLMAICSSVTLARSGSVRNTTTSREASALFVHGRRRTIPQMIMQLANCDSTRDVQRAFDSMTEADVASLTRKMGQLAYWCKVELITRNALVRLRNR